jgi:hypothetical protein
MSTHENSHGGKRRRSRVAERETLVRARLAASRDELLASSIAMKAQYATQGPSLPARGLELVSTAPNVTLLAATLVGALVVGPRKMATLVVRNGLVGWVGKSVRRRVGR